MRKHQFGKPSNSAAFAAQPVNGEDTGNHNRRDNAKDCKLCDRMSVVRMRHHVHSLCLRLWRDRIPAIRKIAATRPSTAIEYDAARSGSLLLVDGGNAGSHVRASERPPTLTEFADRVGRKVVTVGGLTVLAPTTMQVIEDRPGTPDPYARLKPEERLRVLLSLFSEDQWKRAGSASGIGLEDLNDNQRQLFMGLLPMAISVQRNLLVAGNEPISIIYEPQGDPQQEDPAATHLRLNRKVSFSFSKAGTDDYGYEGGIDPGPGDKVTTLIQGRDVRGDAPDDPDTVKAFGVPIIQTVPSRLKRSQLDFAAPRLRMQIPLDGDLKTLGDLLSRVAQITGLELVADRRIATLPLLWRMATSQKARAGDILEALCWSVTGAFRRVGRPDIFVDRRHPGNRDPVRKAGGVGRTALHGTPEGP